MAIAIGSILAAGLSGLGQSRVPEIETKAPGAFADRLPAGASETSAHYRIDATVFLPLLVASIPIASRDDVGTGTATGRMFAAEEHGQLRTYEFFAASRPDRARGLNRLGFLREAAWVAPEGVQWTAHFGVVSSTREATREEARLDQPVQVEEYTVVDGFMDRRGSRSTVAHLDLEGTWPSAGALYAEVRSLWEVLEPNDESRLENAGGTVYHEPVGFLGAIQHSLRTAARGVVHEGHARQYRYRFLHRSRLHFLDLEQHDVDEGRQRRYVEAGLVGPEVPIHKLSYRIVSHDGDSLQTFELWTELPIAAFDRPIVPIAFEFKARAFLELRAVRVLDATSNAATPAVAGAGRVRQTEAFRLRSPAA